VEVRIAPDKCHDFTLCQPTCAAVIFSRSTPQRNVVEIDLWRFAMLFYGRLTKRPAPDAELPLGKCTAFPRGFGELAESTLLGHSPERTLARERLMRSNRSVPPCPVIPVLQYPDPGVAAEWLSKAFGFTVRLRIANHRIQMRAGEGCCWAAEFA
jgi:hypothetical protein